MDKYLFVLSRVFLINIILTVVFFEIIVFMLNFKFYYPVPNLFSQIDLSLSINLPHRKHYSAASAFQRSVVRNRSYLHGHSTSDLPKAHHMHCIGSISDAKSSKKQR